MTDNALTCESDVSDVAPTKSPLCAGGYARVTYTRVRQKVGKSRHSRHYYSELPLGYRAKWVYGGLCRALEAVF